MIYTKKIKRHGNDVFLSVIIGHFVGLKSRFCFIKNPFRIKFIVGKEAKLCLIRANSISWG